MIIFDAGKTLLDYLDIDTLRGVREYSKYITENPQNLTPEDIDREVNTIFETFEASRKALFEVHEQTVLKLAFDLLGLKFSIGVEENIVFYAFCKFLFKILAVIFSKHCESCGIYP